MIGAIKRLFGIGRPSTDYKEMMKQGAIIIDVRSKGEYASGHIENAINIPLDQLSGELKKLKNKNQVIICCCASGMRSGNAKRILESKGYKTVFNGGGWMGLNRKLQ